MPTVTDYLVQKRVPFEKATHARAFTSVDEARALGIDADLVAKALVLLTEAGFVLAVIPGDRRLDLKQVRETLGDPNARLATEAEIQDAFPGYELGALPPIGSLLHVRMFVDRELATHDSVVFADGFQTESIRMRLEDLLANEHAEIAPLTASTWPGER